MSTSALVVYYEGDTYFSATVGHDGYPEHLGKILREHFSDRANAKALCQTKDIDTINPVDGTVYSYLESSGPYEDEHIGDATGRFRVGRTLFIDYVYIWDPCYGWSAYKPEQYGKPLMIPRDEAKYWDKPNVVPENNSVSLEDWLADAKPETFPRSYYGDKGCMCGCKGKYSEKAHVTKRRLDDVRKLIANGVELTVSNMPGTGMFFGTEYGKTYGFYFKEDADEA